CAPTPLAGDNLIAALRDGPHHDRLHDTMLAHRGGEILQFRFVEISPRVARIAADELYRNHAIGIERLACTGRRGHLVHLADQRCKTATESPFRVVFIHGLYSHFPPSSGLALPLSL